MTPMPAGLPLISLPLTEEKRKELLREDEYIRRTGEMGGTGALGHKRGQGPAMDTYRVDEVAAAWGVTVDVVKRLSELGLLGRRFKQGNLRGKLTKGGLSRALGNPLVVKAIADGRLRKLEHERRRDAADRKGL